MFVFIKADISLSDFYDIVPICFLPRGSVNTSFLHLVSGCKFNYLISSYFCLCKQRNFTNECCFKISVQFEVERLRQTWRSHDQRVHLTLDRRFQLSLRLRGFDDSLNLNSQFPDAKALNLQEDRLTSTTTCCFPDVPQTNLSNTTCR